MTNLWTELSRETKHGQPWGTKDLCLDYLRVLVAPASGRVRLMDRKYKETVSAWHEEKTF